MKSLLAKIATRKAIGVYFDDHEVVVSKVAATPLGPIEVARHSARAEPDQIAETLERVLAPLLSRRKAIPIPVAIGIPAHRVFFSTRPIRATNIDASPKILLHEVLQSSSVSIDEMAVDLIKSVSGSRSLASIASCSKKYLSGLLATLESFGVRPIRAEPAPCALLRAATQLRQVPRKVRTVLRIFLSENQGLAVLATPTLPAVWRNFELLRGDEGSAIVCVTRSLQTLSRHCGIDSIPDTVMIHGRIDLRNLLEVEELSEQIGMGLIWSEGPGLNSAGVALGLALGCLNQDDAAFDLAQTLKPRPSVRELFPWGELALQASLLFCTGLFLSDRSKTWNRTYATVQAEIAQHDRLASTSKQELEKEKKDLACRVDAIRKFLTGRITWTSYTHDISDSLPKSAMITSLQGACEFETGAKKNANNAKPKKTLVLKGAAPIAKNGSIPQEIDEFMNKLRENPVLEHDFPIVELADIKWFQPNSGASSPQAHFTVVCLPKTAKATPKASRNGSDRASKTMEN